MYFQFNNMVTVINTIKNPPSYKFTDYFLLTYFLLLCHEHIISCLEWSKRQMY